MGVSGRERTRRKEIESLYRWAQDGHLNIREVDESAEIVDQAVAEFERQLIAKAQNLQPGEALVITFQADIVTADGKVRGGSGSQRNMPEYIEWRTAVYERDGYQCQECGSTDRLNAHHIKSWAGHPALRFEIDNGQTLCFECHKGKHPHIGWMK